MTPAAWESQFDPDTYVEPTEKENRRNIAKRDAYLKERDEALEAEKKEKEKDRKKAEELKTNQEFEDILNNPNHET